jgi:hypothetical protein
VRQSCWEGGYSDSRSGLWGSRAPPIGLYEGRRTVHTPCSTEDWVLARTRSWITVSSAGLRISAGRRRRSLLIGRGSFVDRCAFGLHRAPDSGYGSAEVGDNDIRKPWPQGAGPLSFEAARMSLTRHNLRDYGTRRSSQSFLSVSIRGRWRDVIVIRQGRVS